MRARAMRRRARSAALWSIARRPSRDGAGDAPAGRKRSAWQRPGRIAPTAWARQLHPSGKILGNRLAELLLVPVAFVRRPPADRLLDRIENRERGRGSVLDSIALCTALTTAVRGADLRTPVRGHYTTKGPEIRRSGPRNGISCRRRSGP